MKTYIADIIPKIQKFSQKLDNLTMLTNQHWVVLDELEKSKTVYIFRANGELLIAVNGKVEKAKWEYLGENTILIDLKEESYLFRHGFFDKNVLALKIDSIDEYAILINESKYEGELNSISAVLDFLSNNYIINALFENKNLIKTSENLINDISFVKSGYNLKMGGFAEYIVIFNNSRKFNMYRKNSNGKFFIYLTKEIIVFPDSETCIKYIENHMSS